MKMTFAHNWLGADFECHASFEQVLGDKLVCSKIEVYGPDGENVTEQLRSQIIILKSGHSYTALSHFYCAADDNPEPILSTQQRVIVSMLNAGAQA